MSYSIILRTTTRGLVPLMLLFSVVALLRGHNHPGGGFVGGLVATAAFALVMIAFGVERARRELRFDTRLFIAVGLLLALGSALIGPLFNGTPFMTGVWPREKLGLITPSTPLLFDIGVYFVVQGVLLTVLFALAEENQT